MEKPDANAITAFDAVKYFTDLTVDLNGVIIGLMTLHATVLLAAAGWAVSNRSQPRGVSLWLLPFVVVGLGSFAVVNIASLQNVYDKFNASIDVIRKFWDNQPAYKQEAATIFQPVGKADHTSMLSAVVNWQVVLITVDVAAIAFITLALSNFGRKAPTNAPPAKS